MAAGRDLIWFRRAGCAAAALLSVLAVLCAIPGLASAALTWSGPVAHDPLGTGPPLVAVACPAAELCVALEEDGDVLTFTPGAAGEPTATSIDANTPVALSCISSSECVEVDSAGEEVTFDPGMPASASPAEPAATLAAPYAIDSGATINALSCVSGSSVCVAVDAAGDVVSFDPSDPASSPGPQLKQVDPNEALMSVGCPSDDTCMAVDGAGSQVTFDPSTLAVSSEGTIDNQVALTAVTCPSTSECIAFDGQGNEIAVDLNGTTNYSSLTLDSGNAIIAAACPSATQCTAIDAAGNEVSFAPGAPGSSAVIDPEANLTGLACGGSSTCVAVNAEGRAIVFDPSGAPAPAPAPVTDLLDGTAYYTAVACPLASQCTAADASGDEVTFDPQTGEMLGSSPVDPGAQTVFSIACPSPAQCTIVDSGGAAVTFNPQAPGTPSTTVLVRNHALIAVACPLVAQCTALDDAQEEITFNPNAPSAPGEAQLGTQAGTSLIGLDCPSATECAAVDGIGEVVIFDPRAPGHPTPALLLGAAAVAVACPTSAECVAVDVDGGRTTFDPVTPADAASAHVDSSQPSALACPGATYCVLLDSSGSAVEFDPHGQGPTASSTIIGGASPSAVACGSPSVCVAVDAAADAFVGTGTLPSLPVGERPPAISGTATEGMTLSASSGVWVPDPTSYLQQWERCAANGGSCTSIPGATAGTYTLSAVDVGHTVRVLEVAADQAGMGAPLLSPATARVRGLPAAPVVSDVSLSGVASGRPRLAFSLTASPWGPDLRRLEVVLPSGLSLKAGGGSATGLEVESGGRALDASVRAGGGVLIITLRREVDSLRVIIGASRLAAQPALIRRARSHPATKLSLAVVLSASGATTLRSASAVSLG